MDIFVARRPEPWRDQLWSFCHRRWSALGHRVWEGDDVDPDNPLFNRAASRNSAAAKAHDWTVGAIVDADIIIPGKQLKNAEAIARQTRGVVYAFDQFVALSKSATHDIMHRDWHPVKIVHRLPTMGARWTKDDPISASCIVIHREAWEVLGGFDERFVGWGFEDRAFHEAARSLADVDRLAGPAYHLWHPRSDRDDTSEAFQQNRLLSLRYRKTNRERPEDMAALLAEPGAPHGS